MTHEDFDLTGQSGQLINPEPVVLLVHDADDAAVMRLLAESPLPLSAVYQMYAGNVRQYVPDGQGGWTTTKLRAVSTVPRDLMACALDAELHREARALPLLVMPTVQRYLGCTDWCYINALMKYLTWRQVGYIGLESSRSGAPHVEFPGLQMARGGCAFSLHMAAGTANGIRGLLGSSDPTLVEVRDRVEKMQLEFAAVSPERNPF